MTRIARLIRQTMTVARRDFVATVFTPTFLLFLLAPMIMISFATLGGVGASNVVAGQGGDERIAAIVAPDRIGAVRQADRQLRSLYREARDAPPPLVIETPRGDPAGQARGVIRRSSAETGAVLYGALDRANVLHAPRFARSARYLATLAETVVRTERSGGQAGVIPPRLIELAPVGGAGGMVDTGAGRGMIAFFTVFGLFFLTLLLSGQAVGTMAEERSNKVIEILAAAVPLESVFLGKLLGMFGVALLFVAFWGLVAVTAGTAYPTDFTRTFLEVGPAVGTTAYAVLFLVYFVMAYLLLGAVFLGVGAQASTQRELQMLSLPITVFQMGMLGFASAAASKPDGWVARAAEIFPFSSPFAMAARAANAPELWPHLLGIAWQLLWVSLVIATAAYWFRRGVLQSGSPKLGLGAWLRRRK